MRLIAALYVFMRVMGSCVREVCVFRGPIYVRPIVSPQHFCNTVLVLLVFYDLLPFCGYGIHHSLIVEDDFVSPLGLEAKAQVIVSAW